MGVSEHFRKLVLSSLARSVSEIMIAFHNTAFERLDMRLACLLGQLFERAQSDTIRITHHEIALELGSTREVVSRILKQLEQQGCLVLSRGQIQLNPNQSLPGSK